MLRKIFPKNTIFSTVLSKIVEREIKTKGDQFRWKKNKNFIAVVRKKGNASCHQGGNERQRKKREQERIQHFLHKRVTRKFLEVSRCSRAKQRQRSVPKIGCKVVFCKLEKKNVRHVQSFFFFC